MPSCSNYARPRELRSVLWRYSTVLVIFLVVQTSTIFKDQKLDVDLVEPTIQAASNEVTLKVTSDSILVTESAAFASTRKSRTFSLHRSVYVDDQQPLYRPLQNRRVLGPYANQSLRVPAHAMDAVIMASGPDSTVALCVHNLFHLLGFRRFVFVVNNATLHCPQMMDLVPQHYPTRPHVCLDHLSFYTKEERQNLQTNYPSIHQGAPGKLKRGNQKVRIPRMGWYLQQFSKYLIPRMVPDLSPQYLAIDGDLVFTRPFDFVTDSGQIVLPTTSKSPKQWSYFVELIFDWNEVITDNHNFVVGWMVMDQPILSDLIDTIDHNLANNGTGVFPWNILSHAEEVLNQSAMFSEFYMYARFALYHPSNPYIRTTFAEPARNQGRFKYTCVLSQKIYHDTQYENEVPWMLWEEHKQHAYDACPDGTSYEMNDLHTIGIWHDFHPPPWGGGNQFLLALRHGIEKTGMSVVAKSDKEGIQILQNSSQVLLANSITFKGNTEVLEDLKKRHKLALVHRVDGPYYVARYFQALNFTTLPELPDEDKKTKQINRQFACATVFQSTWSLEANVRIGLGLRNPVVVPNTVNPTLFYSLPRTPRDARKIKVVATSHSNNVRKGFDTMMWIDDHLDFERFEFVYMGGTPKYGFRPRNIQIDKASGSESVADFLRSGDVYFAPSRYEPASNAVMEALACGLPVLYQKGSSHGDLVGGAGIGFESTGPDLLKALDRLIANYERHVQAIHVPSIEEVSKRYLSVMRWCFYMRHLILN